eukprot:1404245-Rhodomonas_salina.5
MQSSGQKKRNSNSFGGFKTLQGPQVPGYPGTPGTRLYPGMGFKFKIHGVPLAAQVAADRCRRRCSLEVTEVEHVVITPLSGTRPGYAPTACMKPRRPLCATLIVVQPPNQPTTAATMRRCSRLLAALVLFVAVGSAAAEEYVGFVVDM